MERMPLEVTSQRVPYGTTEGEGPDTGAQGRGDAVEAANVLKCVDLRQQIPHARRVARPDPRKRVTTPQLSVRKRNVRVSAMSVNIRVELDVRRLVSHEQAEEVRQAVHGVLSDEGIDREVTLSPGEFDGEFMVLGRTGHPLIISGVSRWEPKLKAAIEAAVETVTADAGVRLLCVDVDLERAMEEGTV